MKQVHFLLLNHIKDTWQTAWRVLKIMIPVSVIVKVLDLLGFITILGDWLAPVMEWMGLPTSFGLITATTAFANLYSGIYVFTNFTGSESYTQAQVTVLALMMLLAHTLPIELEVANSVGVKRWFMFLVRFSSVFLAGITLHKILFWGAWLQGKSVPIFTNTSQKLQYVWYEWIAAQLKNYAFIIIIIFCILLMMKLLKYFGIITFLQKTLAPMLKILGMNKEILPMTLVGILVGLVFGSALIIKEKEENPNIHPKDFVYAMVLLGLCHAIIEDTLLVMGIGASIWGVLLFRIIYSLGFTYAFVNISRLNFFKKHLKWISHS